MQVRLLLLCAFYCVLLLFRICQAFQKNAAIKHVVGPRTCLIRIMFFHPTFVFDGRSCVWNSNGSPYYLSKTDFPSYRCLQNKRGFFSKRRVSFVAPCPPSQCWTRKFSWAADIESTFILQHLALKMGSYLFNFVLGGRGKWLHEVSKIHVYFADTGLRKISRRIFLLKKQQFVARWSFVGLLAGLPGSLLASLSYSVAPFVCGTLRGLKKWFSRFSYLTFFCCETFLVDLAAKHPSNSLGICWCLVHTYWHRLKVILR